MATSDYDQNDTDQVCTLDDYCHTGNSGSIVEGRQVEIGVGLGSTEFLGTVNQEAVDATEFNFECILPGDVVSPSDVDTATININFTTGHMDVTLESVFLCRVNSSCVNQETIGSASGLGLATDGGVVSPTVSCSAVTFSAGDKVITVLGLSNPSTMFSRAIGITPDQVFALPFNGVPPAGIFVPLAFDHLAMGHHS